MESGLMLFFVKKKTKKILKTAAYFSSQIASVKIKEER